MRTKGYDPVLSLERRLREAKTLRSRLNLVIRGLGLSAADQVDTQMYSQTLGRFIPLPDQDEAVDELLRWWDKAAVGELGTVSSLAELTKTLRPQDDIAKLATARRTQLTKEINKATKAGDMETAGALTAELDTIKQGRYLPDENVAAEAAPAPEPARRPAEPSEVAANKLEPEDTEQLTALRTELAGTEAKFQDLDHQVASLNDQRNALEISLAQAEGPVAQPGVTGESVIRDLEQLVADSREGIPKGKYSEAELELARVRSAWFSENLPDDLADNAPEWGQLDQLSEDSAQDERERGAEPRAAQEGQRHQQGPATGWRAADRGCRPRRPGSDGHPDDGPGPPDP